MSEGGVKDPAVWCLRHGLWLCVLLDRIVSALCVWYTVTMRSIDVLFSGDCHHSGFRRRSCRHCMETTLPKNYVSSRPWVCIIIKLKPKVLLTNSKPICMVINYVSFLNSDYWIIWASYSLQGIYFPQNSLLKADPKIHRISASAKFHFVSPKVVVL